MITLGIESSCDDTAVAVLSDGVILANIVSGQNRIHEKFGGIVPELASRKHIESITGVIDTALDNSGCTLHDIDLIAATQGPGLIGSLLVGFTFAKSLSYTLNIPYVGVDHMAAHILSVFLEDNKPLFPYIALIVSGGTTALFRARSYYEFDLLGRTRDDAAGEAFDKVARLLGLGYPGGPIVSSRAAGADSGRVTLPRAWLKDSFDFSFSGLKTAVLNHCNTLRSRNQEIDIAETCASFEEAVVEVLVEKTIAAARVNKIERIVIGGGVSANKKLRESLESRCAAEQLSLYLPAPENCTDNGAMIAFSGMMNYEKGLQGTMADDVFSRSHLGL